MFGADYYDAPDDRRDQNTDFDAPLQEDRYFYSDDGQVAWGGSYVQLEWDKPLYSAFVNLSGAQSWYRGIDYFRRGDHPRGLPTRSAPRTSGACRRQRWSASWPTVRS